MTEIREFKYLLQITTEKIQESHNDFTSNMQPYDIAAFHQELNSEYKMYSEKYFDKELFNKMALDAFGLDLTDEYIADELYDYIRDYSRALISYKTLMHFIKINNIITEKDNGEEMVYSR